MLAASDLKKLWNLLTWRSNNLQSQVLCEVKPERQSTVLPVGPQERGITLDLGFSSFTVAAPERLRDSADHVQVGAAVSDTSSHLKFSISNASHTCCDCSTDVNHAANHQGVPPGDAGGLPRPRLPHPHHHRGGADHRRHDAGGGRHEGHPDADGGVPRYWCVSVPLQHIIGGLCWIFLLWIGWNKAYRGGW